ncbi:hypothetical protein MLIT_00040 [Mycolicibacterium litorale]|uniref:Uncharacterized protein n=1 Tax=Mycolicibacterium litorale TaxID=758802 RepID=A0AAD1MSP4_9MYCO|nr:hypothetical protein MLIT_00040 [Mycolicibacterium litorale]
MTRDFIVETVVSVPSTERVTVFWAVTAYPPAKATATSSAATTMRSMGERASCSLFRAVKSCRVPDYWYKRFKKGG